jgi:UDP-N-acetylglucosamine 3-dehydrogenase
MANANKARIRIGVLGTGFGKTHARIFASFPDVEVSGIVGRNEQKTREVARSLGIQAYTDPKELIDRPDIDAIVICCPTNTHAEYVIAALNQDKHVFCETPVSYTLIEAEQMSQTAKSCEKLLLIALFGRFVSDYRYIHDFINAGHLGAPKVVFLNRRTPPIWGNGWNENFITDLMLHDIDYLHWVFGKPIAVTSRGLGTSKDGWNHVNIACEFDGMCAVVEGCGIMPTSFPFSTSLRVVGEEGAIDLNWYWGGEHPTSEAKFFPKKGEPGVLSIPDYDPYKAECRYFVDCLRDKAEPHLLSIDSAYGSLRIALAAKKSLEQNGKRIEV